MGMLREPISGPSAWDRAAMERDPSWILRLTPAEVAEVEVAVERVAARGLRGAEFGREDFPLPTLAPLLARALGDLESGRGVVLLRGLPVDPRDVERAGRIAWGLGVHLGRPLRQIPRVNLAGWRDNLIGHIADQGIDYNAPNAIGSGTSAEQMPHVDGSDLVALLCVRPAADGGGVSRVVSAMRIYNALLERHPDLLEVLYEGFYHDLRGDEAKDSGLRVTPHRIPVFSWFGGVLSCNFNVKTVEQGAAKRGVPLSRRERAALDAMLALALDPAFSIEMRFETGDFQLVNNYTVLHSRTAWRDPPEPERKRLLLRLWLKSFAARPLAPNFAGGYVTGAAHDVSRATLAAS
jgi:alpha-ketoglutarate-dependent taurine dioxygenase